jgi:hypothetical protein
VPKTGLFHDPDIPARGVPKILASLRAAGLFYLPAIESKLSTPSNKKAPSFR